MRPPQLWSWSESGGWDADGSDEMGAANMIYGEGCGVAGRRSPATITTAPSGSEDFAPPEATNTKRLSDLLWIYGLLCGAPADPPTMNVLSGLL